MPANAGISDTSGLLRFGTLRSARPVDLQMPKCKHFGIVKSTWLGAPAERKLPASVIGASYFDAFGIRPLRFRYDENFVFSSLPLAGTCSYDARLTSLSS